MSAILKQPAITLRPMIEADIGQVISIEQEVYVFPWSELTFRNCIQAGYYCWLLVKGAKIIGYGIMSIVGDEAHILNLCIRAKLQNSGWGSSLLTHMLQFAKQQQVQLALLEVRLSNKIALQLYQKMGFNQIGRRKDYYPAEMSREDALILECQLADLE